MKQRTWIAGAALAALTLPAAAQLSCDRSLRAGKLVCDDASVRALVGQLAAESQRLGCTAVQDLQELASVRQAWGRQQFACDRSADLRSCVMRSLRAEIEYFNAMPACEVRQRPLKFDSVIASYLLAHPATYQGGEVAVLGAAVPDACGPDARSLTGTIADLADDHLQLVVHFKSLPAVQREVLCSKRPFAAWTGRVSVSPDGTPYLYVTDVLGNPLP